MKEPNELSTQTLDVSYAFSIYFYANNLNCERTEKNVVRLNVELQQKLHRHTHIHISLDFIFEISLEFFRSKSTRFYVKFPNNLKLKHNDLNSALYRVTTKGTATAKLERKRSLAHMFLRQTLTITNGWTHRTVQGQTWI